MREGKQRSEGGEGASCAQSQDRELQPKAVAHTRALRQECLTHSWGRGQCG